MRKRRKINVKVPPGIDEGYQLRLRGEGELSTRGGGSPGDLYVLIHMKPHKYFKREDENLWYDLKISFSQAALGTQISVPTLEGDEKLKIRSGTQPGEIVKLKGKGMPKFRGYGKGDLLIRVALSVPEKLTKKQRALIKQLEEEFDEKVESKRSRIRW